MVGVATNIIPNPGAPQRIWARQGQILYIFWMVFFYEPIENQNIRKAQALGALLAMAPLHENFYNPLFNQCALCFLSTHVHIVLE